MTIISLDNKHQKNLGSQKEDDQNEEKSKKERFRFFSKTRSRSKKAKKSKSETTITALTTTTSEDRISTVKTAESVDKITAAEDAWIAKWSKRLISRKWYHGVMPREASIELLKNDGDFLVRKTTEKSRPIFCLTVLHNNEPRHFTLLNNNSFWTINAQKFEEAQKFAHLVQLLNFLVSEKCKLQPSDAILVRGISRPKYYILHDEIVLDGKLGAGAFGQVWRGKFWRKNEAKDVAIKRLNHGKSGKEILRGFVKEAKLVQKLNHPNLIRVIGIAPTEEPLMIILELAKNGCLKNYLHNLSKKEKRVEDEILIGFCLDMARGMAYLAAKMIIHRDLAARNLLLGEKMEVKISDFGLSECGKIEARATKIKVPIRWLAPESIDTLIFTTKSDVWAFAVTMWEIFSMCASDPFPGLTNRQAKDIIRDKSKNPPMDPPNETPKQMAKLMVECFERNVEERPGFAEIMRKLAPENEDLNSFEVFAPKSEKEQDESKKEVTETILATEIVDHPSKAEKRIKKQKSEPEIEQKK